MPGKVRIVGGTETGVNEFPSMAGLVSKRGTEPYCGATIIDANYAMTAAHCINTAGHHANEIDLLVGDHDFTNRKFQQIQHTESGQPLK